MNKINGKSYVGSGKDLKIRLNCYYKKNMLKKEKRPICYALLKYGHNNFTLEILEYCPISKLIKREQYYLDLLKPEYNICKIAYSTLGYKHRADTIALLKKKMTPEVLELLKQKKISPEHKEILSLTHKGKVVGEETRKKLAIATTRYRKNNPLSAEALANIKAKTTEREGVAVTVLNTETNET
jgi:group I intron endonuclease